MTEHIKVWVAVECRQPEEGYFEIVLGMYTTMEAAVARCEMHKRWDWTPGDKGMDWTFYKDGSGGQANRRAEFVEYLAEARPIRTVAGREDD